MQITDFVTEFKRKTHSLGWGTKASLEIGRMERLLNKYDLMYKEDSKTGLGLCVGVILGGL